MKVRCKICDITLTAKKSALVKHTQAGLHLQRIANLKRTGAYVDNDNEEIDKHMALRVLQRPLSRTSTMETKVAEAETDSER